MRGATELLYRSILRLYPPDFRERSGPELVAVFRRRVSDAGGSRAGRLATAAREVLDLLRNLGPAWAERWGSRGGGRRAGNALRGVRRRAGLSDDLLHAWRALVRRPGPTLGAVLVTGLGLGVVAAFVSVVGGVLYEPLPYDDPDRVVALTEVRPGSDAPFSAVSPAAFEILDRELASAEPVAYRITRPILDGDDDRERTEAVRVTADFFAVLGVGAALGRLPGPGDEGVAALSHGLWERRFGADPSIVGRTVRLDDTPHTVVGVLPEGFGVDRSGGEIWVPLEEGTPGEEGRHERSLAVLLRIAPDRAPGEVRAELSALTPAISETVDVPARLLLREDAVERDAFFRGVDRIFLAAAGLLLLVTCSNVAGILLARGARRRPELAVRAAMGGSRRRIFFQQMLESALIAGAAAALGLLVARGVVRLFTASLPTELPWWSEVELVDPVVLAATSVATLLTVVLVGTAPALEAARVDLRRILVGGGHGGTAGPGQRRLRSLAVGVQMALSFLLVVVAALAWRSADTTRSVELGWDADRVVLARVEAGAADDTAGLGSSMAVMAERAGALPEVLGVAWSATPSAVDGVVLDGGTILVGDGETRPLRGVEERAVSPGFFAVSGVPLVEGRTPEPGGPPAAVVSRSLAGSLWPGGSPVGRTLRVGELSLPVIGVTGDVTAVRGGRGGLRAEREATLYLPLEHATFSDAELRVRADDPEALAPILREALRDVEGGGGARRMEPALESEIGGHLALGALFTSVFTFFGALALALATAGLYGLVAYSVALRTREIGVRVALGADPASVVGWVLRDAGRLSAVALAVGFALAAALSPLLGALFFDTALFEPRVHLPAAAVLALVVLLASAIPAMRALAVSPVEALRSG